MNLVKAACVFLFFAFIYTVIFYAVTPAVMMFLDFISENISTAGWSAEAVYTFNMIATGARWAWLWVCVLSFLSTVAWYYLYPYREEVWTDERY